MGLDMYFYERHYMRMRQNKRGRFVRPSFTIPTEAYNKGRKRFKNVSYIYCLVGQFRKANAIHSWIMNQCCDGDMTWDCRYVLISPDIIQELKDICLKLLGLQGKKFRDAAEELLPTHKGFFWGSLAYDKYYRADLRDFVKMCNKLNLDDPDVDIMYYPSW